MQQKYWCVPIKLQSVTRVGGFNNKQVIFMLPHVLFFAATDSNYHHKNVHMLYS